MIRQATGRKGRKKMKVKQNGVMVDKSYEDVCHDLGFFPSINFVDITKNGTITFTCGKPDEIYALFAACNSKGYSPSKRLENIARRR